MIKETRGGFVLHFEDEKREILTGSEGQDAVLDLTGFETLKRIDRKAFLSCKSLRRVHLPAGIEQIAEWAFSKCANLEQVTIAASFHGNLFGKGAFEGCSALREISFLGSEEGLSRLLALTVNRMPNDHLLRSDDLGQQSWYARWDIHLSSFLKNDSLQSLAEYATGGEEDLPFDDVGMIDGEMPGEGVDVLKSIEQNKCLLAYLRLRYSRDLSEETREFLSEYIAERGFGKKNAHAWHVLEEECGGDPEFYRQYVDIVKPDKATLHQMVESLGAAQIQARAFLIGQASGNDPSNDFFDDLMLL